jgi:hypothetical protein
MSSTINAQTAFGSFSFDDIQHLPLYSHPSRPLIDIVCPTMPCVISVRGVSACMIRGWRRSLGNLSPARDVRVMAVSRVDILLRCSLLRLMVRCRQGNRNEPGWPLVRFNVRHDASCRLGLTRKLGQPRNGSLW